MHMPTSVSDLVAAARRIISETSPESAALSLRGGADVVLIDVREPAEFAAGHIQGSINIPRGVLEFQVESHPALGCVTEPALSVRHRPLLICCRSGGRAALAAASLAAMGFSEVRSVAGGIQGWADAGLPLTTS